MRRHFEPKARLDIIPIFFFSCLKVLYWLTVPSNVILVDISLVDWFSNFLLADMFPVEYEQHFHGSRFTQWLIIFAPIVVEPSSRTRELQLIQCSRWILYLIRRAKYLLFIGCSGRSPPKQFKINLCRLSCMPVFVIYVECERWLVKIPEGWV